MVKQIQTYLPNSWCGPLTNLPMVRGVKIRVAVGGSFPFCWAVTVEKREEKRKDSSQTEPLREVAPHTLLTGGLVDR